ncbi:MAG: hypothetical protein HY328_02220 [Chloroflexi bacterium]|nr:hypothetical protein [Chloroflexota bacterium]
MLEIRLHTLLLVVAGTVGLIALPFVVRSLSDSALPVHAAGQALPTPTPVPTQGLSERARELAASLVLTPTPDALPTPLPPAVSATVRTDGRPLNLRRGPGLDHPVLGSAPNGLLLSVTGVSRDGAWLRVEVPEWESGVWIYAALTEVEGNLAIVPTAGE